MTAHDPKLDPAAEIAARVEIEACIGFLADSQSRRRIMLAYSAGWITAEDALELLTSLQLIEVPE
jgi:predicted DNA-binding ArsR family transcriptional regulator